MENNTIKRVQRPPKGGVKHNNPVYATPKKGVHINKSENGDQDTPISANGNKKGLLIGIAAALVVILGLGAFFLFRSPIKIETTKVQKAGLQATLYSGINNKTTKQFIVLWPEGVSPIAQNIREWICMELNISSLTANPPKKMEEELKNGHGIHNINFYPVEDDFIIATYDVAMAHDLAYFRKSDGEQLNNEILQNAFPDYLSMVKEAVNNADLSKENLRELNRGDYENFLRFCYPYFSENGLENKVSYGYVASNVPDFKFVIPYEALIGVASEEILKFIPEKYLTEFSQKGEKLTSQLVEKLAKKVSPHEGPSTEILSDEFAKICTLGKAMPGYIGSIGEEEIMGYWHGGQDEDSNWSVKNVDFVTASNDQALVNIDYVHYGNANTVQIKFVTKAEELPSVITASKWVIDDFNNMKGQILEAINSQYENLSKKSIDEILSEEGENLSAAEKEAYKSKVEKFLELYREHIK